MAWNVSVDEIIKRWVGEAPDTDDVLLTTLVSDAVILLKKKEKSIEKRLNPEPVNGVPQLPEEDLQDLLNSIVSKMVQRAYHSDYTSYTNVSNTVGPQSASYSKASDNKQGIYILPEEMALIALDRESASRIKVLKNKATPNFNTYGSYDGWWGYGSW